MPSKSEWKEALLETERFKRDSLEECKLCELCKPTLPCEDFCILYRLHGVGCASILEDAGIDSASDPRIADLIEEVDLPALELIPETDPFFQL